MNNLTPIIIIAITFFAFNLQAQGVNQALKEFQQTEFMVQFTKKQYEAKQSVRKFKMNADLYDAAKVADVKEAYNKTALQYNKLLISIKEDFLNRNKMKFIANMPDVYSKALESDLKNVEEFYSSNYQQALSDVTGEEPEGNVLVLISEICKLVKTVVQKIIEIKQAAKHFTDAMLQNRIVESNRFLYWDEIQVPTIKIVTGNDTIEITKS